MAQIIARTALGAALVFILFSPSAAQTLTLQQALDAAVQYQPAGRAAALQAEQQRQLLPAATALSNPTVVAESPTGNFYTIGVTQAFELPAAYWRRAALQKSRIARAESGITATQQDIRYTTALAYNELQYRIALAARLHEQDSTLQAVAGAAIRQFEQGQIDAVASRLATLQAATLRTRLHQAEQDVRTAESQLQLLTGLSGRILPEPLAKPAPAPVVDSAQWQNSPALRILRQEALVAEQQVVVEKTGRWPQFTFGYLNQGERNSPVANRFNAGITIPLWRGQSNARIASAQTGVEIARQNLDAQSLETGVAWRQAFGEAEKARLALEEYEQSVLPGARALTDASGRLYAGGMSDLPTYLRYRKDVLEIELDYWKLLRDVQVAELELKYISGTL